ncbi:MAG TPA: helix-turn-helix domain-containing protein [Burkholderiales bacterium]|nr:helix-turn-helix domain-containing protein [Burkholderiales bacterium]
MIRYGQYCPIAKALELLADRWTLLIIRELLMGSRRFNDLRRGMPLISPSVLSQRLKTLGEHHIVVRESKPPSFSYQLTTAGQELRPLIMQLGTWGQRWSRSRMTAQDLDASFLMWDIRRNLRFDKLPKEVVIFVELTDAKRGMKNWWLVVDAGEADLCLEDPGREVDISLSSSLRTMTQIWMGDISLSRARDDDLLKVYGKGSLVRSIGSWLGFSPFAHVAPAESRAPRAADLSATRPGSGQARPSRGIALQ